MAMGWVELIVAEREPVFGGGETIRRILIREGDILRIWEAPDGTCTVELQDGYTLERVLLPLEELKRRLGHANS